MLRTLSAALLLMLIAAGPATNPSPRTLRVYHIGNSVTDSIRYQAFDRLVERQGNTYVFGRHMMPGTPLFGLWDNQDKGFTEKPFGPSIAALRNFEWDVITLQPFDRLLEGDRESEFESCVRFIDVALEKNGNAQIYIYQRWPKRAIVGKPRYDGTDVCKPIDYAAAWNRSYTGKWDGTYETRDFFEKLTAKLNAQYAGRLAKPVRIVPVGDALARFDEAIRAGRVPAMASINDLYLDNVHLNDLGKCLVGLTFYATLYDADVRGIDASAYGTFDAQTLAVVQECVAAAVAAARDAK